MPNPLIVVTGATGRTGRQVLEHLLGRDDVAVRAAVHDRSKAAFLPAEVELVELEYTREASMQQALQGASKLYWVMPGGVEQIAYTRTMVCAALAAGVQHIVKVGSLDPDVEPITGTDRQCLESERLITASGIAYTFIRCSFYNQMFVSGVDGLRQGSTFMALAEGKTGWVDCRDIGAVAATTLAEGGHANKIYNLTGPQLLSFTDIQAIMERVAQRPLTFVSLPEEVLLQMFQHESPECVEARLGCLKKLRGSYIAYTTGDVERVLGRPPIAFERFVRDYAGILFADSMPISHGDSMRLAESARL